MATDDVSWLNSNAAAIQAVGSVLAILIAVGVAWLSHWLDIRRSEGAVRRQEARTLETVASIVINAMNLIQTAKEETCDGGEASLRKYCKEIHNPSRFKDAEQALREIPIAQLPDFEVVKPVIEMRGLVPEVNAIIDFIHRDYLAEGPEWRKESERLERLHRRANVHTVTVEVAVRRARDGD